MYTHTYIFVYMYIIYIYIHTNITYTYMQTYTYRNYVHMHTNLYIGTCNPLVQRSSYMCTLASVSTSGVARLQSHVFCWERVWYVLGWALCEDPKRLLCDALFCLSFSWSLLFEYLYAAGPMTPLHTWASEPSGANTQPTPSIVSLECSVPLHFMWVGTSLLDAGVVKEGKMTALQARIHTC